MIPVKISNEDKRKLHFLKMCEYNSYIEEDLPKAPQCVKGSRKVSKEQFYALIF